MTTKTLDSANTRTAMKLSSTDSANGVQVIEGYKLQVSNTGIYNIQFFAQLIKTSGGVDPVDICLGINGNNVTWSSIQFQFNKDERKVAAWNFAVSLNANDFVTLY